MNGIRGLFRPEVLGLLDPDGDRHAEAGHAVEDVAANLCLGLLVGQSPGVKTPADDGLVSVHRGFNEAPPGITGTPLPADTPMPCDRLEMLVACVAAVSLETAVDRGGMTTAASG
jgi:hypothetical protein